MTDVVSAQDCPRCHDGGDARLLRLEGARRIYQCNTCRRTWSVDPRVPSRVQFDADARLD